MTPEERSEMGYLCEMLATAQDLNKFEAVVKELMELIDRKRQRLQLEQPSR